MSDEELGRQIARATASYREACERLRMDDGEDKRTLLARVQERDHLVKVLERIANAPLEVLTTSEAKL